jgi:5-methylcytosine-specific restriction protein A
VKKIRTDNDEDLDSTYSIGSVSGVAGLILESWGPKDRNPEYAQAMELILARLQKLGVPNINVYVVSRPLIVAYPEMDDRAIIIDGQKDIGLAEKTAQELRIAIGRKVKDLREINIKPSSGGNRSKRLLLHSSLLSYDDWETIASNFRYLNLIAPTQDSTKLEAVVNILQKKLLPKPSGVEYPERSAILSVSYYRDPAVKAWVLQNAKGVCEVCSAAAPFENGEGLPYLEVHHVKRLSDGGSDTVENAIAVCPNCHRNLHFGKNARELIEGVVENIARIESLD